jgi:hypothetical protein
MYAEERINPVDELAAKFPLIDKLDFYLSKNGVAEEMPPIISLLAAMTDPKIPGDNCILLPSREHVGFLTAILTALSAAQESFPSLLEKYVEESFAEGERVRVLPTGHVYEFGGYFHHDGRAFFKLKIIGDKTKGARAFPLKEVVRLEKTNRKRPVGKGDTSWGRFRVSKLDYLVGTRSAGNNALLLNEVMLICTQREFLEFMDDVWISKKGQTEHRFSLSDVLPWGTVDSEGNINFKNSAAASGQPVIAVSSRAEYIAAACKKNGQISPRVIIDGASRVRDLQAFDDITDYSKLLVIADHADTPTLSLLADRNCSVFKLPQSAAVLFDNETSLLGTFRKKFGRASSLTLNILPCSSSTVDDVVQNLVEAERMLREDECDDAVIKIVGVAYARLLDTACIVHDAEVGEIDDLSDLINLGQKSLQAHRIWMRPEAHSLLVSVFECLNNEVRRRMANHFNEKQEVLTKFITGLHAEGSRCAITGHSNLAINSARRFLADNCLDDVAVIPLSELSDATNIDDLILTGWPRSRNFSRLLDSYCADHVHALAYGFEENWFHSSWRRRRGQLSSWASANDELQRLTSLNINLKPDHLDLSSPPETAGVASIFDFEDRLSGVRKGAPAGEVHQLEARDAKYVGFVGNTYCYLTETHKIPKVTRLLRSDAGQGRNVPLETVDNISVGDIVLFRIQTDNDKDMVRSIAEGLGKSGEYENVRRLAESWKLHLRSLGDDSYTVWNSLRAAGLERTHQAVRGWLLDPNRIGPFYEDDLRVLARAVDDTEFEGRISEIWQAIQTIRGAHTTAGFKLSQLLFSQLPGRMPEQRQTESIVELTLDDVSLGQVAVVVVEEIAHEYEARRYSEVNHLLWDQV